MPKYTNEDVRAQMDQPTSVRNVVLVASMGQGKTCVMDCLGAQCGLVGEDKIGETRFTHVRADEKEKGCSLKSNVTSMVFGTDSKYLLHLIDTPGHAEYSAEVSVCMPLADGALMMLDGSGQGLPAQTTRHMKMLASQKVKMIAMANRLDVSIVVMEKSASEIYDDLSVLVDALGSAMQALMPDQEPLKPENGEIIFGSAVQGWAFTLPRMAKIYAAKFGIEVEKMSKRLWGEHFFSPKNKKWTTLLNEDSKRAFDQFILDPILKVKSVCDSGDISKLEKMLGALGVKLTADDKAYETKALFRRVMQLWMPAGTVIGDCMVEHLPDPIVGQKERAEILYSGPADDDGCKAIVKCDPHGDMIMQVTKLMPIASAPGRFYALGRVFSGTCVADKVFVVEDDYLPEYHEDPEADRFGLDDADAPSGPPSPAKSGATPQSPAKSGATPKSDGGTPISKVTSKDGGTPISKVSSKGSDSPLRKSSKSAVHGISEHRMQGVLHCQGKTFAAVQSLPCGNICVLTGIDQFIQKRCTVSSTKHLYPMRAPLFDVSPVVRVSVQPACAKDLPKTVEGLRRLAKSCPLVQVTLEEGGDHVVAACGGEHIRVLRRDLQDEYATGIALMWGAPSVSYKESVSAESKQMCLSKSPNKHNRLFMKADVLDEEVCRAIESKQIWQTQDIKTRSKILSNEFGWEKNDTLKIWGFGPAAESATGPVGANVLVDQTKACQYLNEIKESVNSGLLWATKQGPVCEEQMRGIRFNLFDVKLHTDSIHRGMGQIQPTARRVFFACALSANIKLVEPVFMATIDAPVVASAGIMQALGSCRGELVLSEETGDRLNVTAYVPIAETIGTTPFATVLTQKTNGKAFVSYSFDHWETMPSDPLQSGSKANDVMMAIRQRKGLKMENPALADYLDKL